MCAKCFGILVEVEGVADRRHRPESHVVRKPNPYRRSTRMNADQEWGWKAQVHAKSGMTWDAVGYQRRGRGRAGRAFADIAVIAGIARDRKGRAYR